MTKKIFKFILIIAVIILSTFTLSGCQKNEKKEEPEQISRETYVEPLQNYLEGLKTKNLELVLKAYPEFMHMDQKLQLTDIEAVYARYESLYGSNIVFDYNIGEPTIVEENDYGTLASRIKEAYPDAGDISIDKAFILEVELTISGDGVKNANNEEKQEESNEGNSSENGESQKTKTTDHQDFYVYRFNGNWYIF
ncbi:MAG: hypothetical protein J6J36_02415 [Clostridia bacterium]|nr:hypothetical protein [Clostridia bacterium]